MKVTALPISLTDGKSSLSPPKNPTPARELGTSDHSDPGSGSEWSLVPNPNPIPSPNSNSNRSRNHNANVTLGTSGPVTFRTSELSAVNQALDIRQLERMKRGYNRVNRHQLTNGCLYKRQRVIMSVSPGVIYSACHCHMSLSDAETHNQSLSFIARYRHNNTRGHLLHDI